MSAPWAEMTLMAGLVNAGGIGGTGSWMPHAPVTVATNLLLTVQCAVLARVLLGRTRGAESRVCTGCRRASRTWAEGRAPQDRMHRYWVLFFLFMAAASLAGAVKHGHPPESRAPLWLWSVYVSSTVGGLSTACAGLATIEAWVRGGTARSRLRAAIAVQLAVLAVTTVRWPTFVPALVHTVVGLLPVLVVETVGAARIRSGSRAIAAGFAVSGAAAVLYVLKTSVGSRLDHVDLAHMVMMASLALVYRGVRQRVGAGDGAALNRATQVGSPPVGLTQIRAARAAGTSLATGRDPPWRNT